MSNIKVLQLTTYCSLRGLEQELDMYYQEIPVVFNRDGWYAGRKQSWIEYKGKAYTRDGMMRDFIYRLGLLRTDLLDQVSVDAVRLLTRRGVKLHKDLMHRYRVTEYQKVDISRRLRFYQTRKKLMAAAERKMRGA